MNSNEVRLGIWVKHSKNDIYKDGIEGTPTKINLDNIIIAMEDKTNRYFEPIPLSEGILEKCGMRVSDTVDHSYRSVCFECGILTLYADNRDNFSTLRGANDRYIISYLHELQNLFYDLTKTELNVQL